MYQFFISFYGWIIFCCMYIPHFVCLFIEGHLVVSTLWLLWIVLLWRFVYSIWVPFFISLGSISRSRISGSYGNSMFFEEPPNFFYSACIHSHQQCMRILISPYPYQHLLFSIFLSIFVLFLFLTMLCLRCCAWAFSSCSKRGLLFVAVHGLLFAVASLVAEHRL